MTNTKTRNRAVFIASIASVVVSTFLMALKMWAYTQTDSAAVLSSLLDSATDVLVSIMTFASIQYSIRPPDDDHRHGHGKMEGITALAQGILLGAAALLLVYEGFSRLITPVPLPDAHIGIVVMIVSIMLSLGLVRFQRYVARKYHSLAIEADSGHYSGDILINASTIVVLIVIPFTGWVWIDGLFAVVVAGVMSMMAWGIVQMAMDMLLDREVDSEIKRKIAHAILDDQAIRRMHDLRVIRHGMKLDVSYDIEMDGDLTLTAAHDIAIASEDRILAIYPNAEMIVHMDPVGAAHDRRHHMDDGIERL